MIDLHLQPREEPIPHRTRPCLDCLWVRVAPRGRFTREELETWKRITAADALLFPCHQKDHGREFPCAAWLSILGWKSPRVRSLILADRLPMWCIEPVPGWPKLHLSWDGVIYAKARLEKS
jgi:hypothetical protein